MGRYTLIAALLLLFVVVGCGDSTDLTTQRVSLVTDISGNWRWKLLDAPDCPQLDGFLSPDRIEDFDVTQEDNELRATFTDSAGNTVVLNATLQEVNGELRISGTFAIRQPGFQPPPQLTADGGVALCNGKLYLVNEGMGEISVINLQTLSVIKTLDLMSERLGRPCPSPDGKYVFVPDRGRNALVVIDTATDEVARTLSGPDIFEPLCCAVTSDSQTLYVANDDPTLDTRSTPFIAEIDIGSWDVVFTFDTTDYIATDLELTSDDAMLYVAHPDIDRIALYELNTGTQSDARINGPDGVKSLDLSENDEFLYAAGDGGLYEYNLGPTRPGLFGEMSRFLGRGACDVRLLGGNAYISRAFRQLVGQPPYFECIGLGTFEPVDAWETDASRGYGIDFCKNLAFVGMGARVSLRYIDLDSKVQGTIGAFGEWPVFVNVALPREIVIAFDGVGRFNDIDRMVDGDFTVSQDNSPFASQCIGVKHEFWVFVGTGGFKEGNEK